MLVITSKSITYLIILCRQNDGERDTQNNIQLLWRTCAFHLQVFRFPCTLEDKNMPRRNQGVTVSQQRPSGGERKSRMIQGKKKRPRGKKGRMTEEEMVIWVDKKCEKNNWKEM